MVTRSPSAVAIVPVRHGQLPGGAVEAVTEAGGRVIVVGEDAACAGAALGRAARELRVWEAPGFAPGAWAVALAPLLVEEEVVILPASPDARDLAPRIAAVLERPVLAGAVELRADRVFVARYGGLVMAEHPLRDPVVVTLQPGLSGVEHTHGEAPEPAVLDLPLVTTHEPEVLEVLGPDVSTMDLAEAPRIVGGGAGLESAERFEQLAELAARLDAAMGATRVITDRGWVSHERQIGTTGVVVDPRLYVAFGISGAVQHTAGLGNPDQVISINTDPHCPMMTMADLAVVADANATLDELLARLPERSAAGAPVGGADG